MQVLPSFESRRTFSELVRGMHPPTNLPSYSAANVGTPTIGQQENRGSGLDSDRSRDGYWTSAGSTYDIGRPLDHSQLNPLQGGATQGGATQQSSATTLSSYSYTRGVGRIGIGLPACPRSRFTHSTRLSAQQIATNRVLQFGNREQPRLGGSCVTLQFISLSSSYILCKHHHEGHRCALYCGHRYLIVQISCYSIGS